jgi:hypothetical protein
MLNASSTPPQDGVCDAVHPIPCRLCSKSAVKKFSLDTTIAGEIFYYECESCLSLETQVPIWLEKAYADSNLSSLDVGAAQRVLVSHAFILLFAKIFKVGTILDFGGGDGLLCRLLRDRGVEAFTQDQYSAPTYAPVFRGSLEKHYDLITAFEVLEHLPQPSTTLVKLFAAKPRFIVASTEQYSGQDETWWYLKNPQHVFFYSQQAFRFLAEHHGYAYYQVNGRHIFAKDPINGFRLRLISRATQGRLFKWFRASLPYSETWKWIQKDFAHISQRKCT